jgi:Beta-glucosidase-related glycosidases
MAIFILTLFISGCSKLGRNARITNPEKNDTTQPAQNTPTPSPANDPVKTQVDGMTLDEKIGQMVMSGVDGYTLGDTTIKMIKNYHVGGFIILGENVKNSSQLLELVNSLKTANSNNKIPLFLSIDQEGGRIDRMPAEIKRLPANKAVGGVNNSNFSYGLGGILAEELKAFGLNMDFAPVMDINSNPNNPVIGDRSFGSNPDIVAKLGLRTMDGIKSGGIIPVIKHFPGHGDTSVDSHVGLPSVNNDMNRLNSFELVPFAQAVKDGADAVMVAHILLPKIDPKYPASMSETIINGVLRENLNFDGVVITDDMTMGAITKNYNIGDAAVKSVNAGCDIVLVCHVYDNEVAVVNALKKAVQNGTISQERVDRSVYRILKLKQKYGISSKTVKSVDVNNINNKISSILKTYMK